MKAEFIAWVQSIIIGVGWTIFFLLCIPAAVVVIALAPILSAASLVYGFIGLLRTQK